MVLGRRNGILYGTTVKAFFSPFFFCPHEYAAAAVRRVTAEYETVATVAAFGSLLAGLGVSGWVLQRSAGAPACFPSAERSITVSS